MHIARGPVLPSVAYRFWSWLGSFTFTVQSVRQYCTYYANNYAIMLLWIYLQGQVWSVSFSCINYGINSISAIRTDFYASWGHHKL